MEGYPQVNEMLQKVQWIWFIEKFDGFHMEVTKSFVRYFDGIEVEIGDIKFSVTEAFVAEATKLPRTGERWFKNKEIHSEEWKVFFEESMYGHLCLQQRNSQFNTQKQIEKYAFNFTKFCYLQRHIWMYVCLSCSIVDEIFGGWRNKPPILPIKQLKENVRNCA